MGALVMHVNALIVLRPLKAILRCKALLRRHILLIVLLIKGLLCHALLLIYGILRSVLKEHTRSLTLKSLVPLKLWTMKPLTHIGIITWVSLL